MLLPLQSLSLNSVKNIMALPAESSQKKALVEKINRSFLMKPSLLEGKYFNAYAISNLRVLEKVAQAAGIVLPLEEQVTFKLEDEAIFTAHRNLLIYQSDYFARLFNSNGKESSDRVIALEGESKESYTAVIRYLLNPEMQRSFDLDPSIDLYTIYEILVIADRWELHGLAKICEQRILKGRQEELAGVVELITLLPLESFPDLGCFSLENRLHQTSFGPQEVAECTKYIPFIEKYISTNKASALSTLVLQSELLKANFNAKLLSGDIGVLLIDFPKDRNRELQTIVNKYPDAYIGFSLHLYQIDACKRLDIKPKISVLELKKAERSQDFRNLIEWIENKKINILFVPVAGRGIYRLFESFSKICKMAFPLTVNIVDHSRKKEFYLLQFSELLLYQNKDSESFRLCLGQFISSEVQGILNTIFCKDDPFWGLASFEKMYAYTDLDKLTDEELAAFKILEKMVRLLEIDPAAEEDQLNFSVGDGKLLKIPGTTLLCQSNYFLRNIESCSFDLSGSESRLKAYRYVFEFLKLPVDQQEDVEIPLDIVNEVKTIAFEWDIESLIFQFELMLSKLFQAKLKATFGKDIFGKLPISKFLSNFIELKFVCTENFANLKAKYFLLRCNIIVDLADCKFYLDYLKNQKLPVDIQSLCLMGNIEAIDDELMNDLMSLVKSINFQSLAIVSLTKRSTSIPLSNIANLVLNKSFCALLKEKNVEVGIIQDVNLNPCPALETEVLNFQSKKNLVEAALFDRNCFHIVKDKEFLELLYTYHPEYIEVVDHAGQTALSNAIGAEDLSKVEYLLKLGADFSGSNFLKHLFSAVSVDKLNNFVPTIQKYIPEEQLEEFIREEAWNIITVKTFLDPDANFLPLMEWLIERGALASVANLYDYWSLDQNAIALMIEGASHLLDESMGDDQVTPLIQAAIDNNWPLMKFFLEKGASVDCVDSDGNCVLDYFLKGVPVNHRDFLPLFNLIWSKASNSAVVKTCIEKRALAIMLETSYMYLSIGTLINNMYLFIACGADIAHRNPISPLLQFVNKLKNCSSFNARSSLNHRKFDAPKIIGFIRVLEKKIDSEEREQTENFINALIASISEVRLGL